MRASGEMRVGGAVRAGVVVCALLAALAVAGCPGKKEKAAPPPEVTPTVNEIFQQGVDAMRGNEIDKAVMSFSLITQKAHPGAPEIPHAYFYLGLIAYRAGNMELAVQNFNAALKLDPSMDQARLSLGNAQFAAGKVDEAIASWEQLAKERPNLSSVHNNLGVAYLDRNDLDKALEHLEQTVALSPDNYRAQKNLADAYRRKGMTAEADAADRKAQVIENRMLSQHPRGPAGTAAPAGPTAEMDATPEPAAPTATP